MKVGIKNVALNGRFNGELNPHWKHVAINVHMIRIWAKYASFCWSHDMAFRLMIRNTLIMHCKKNKKNKKKKTNPTESVAMSH
jgi:hypothetical protein